MIVGTAGHVDHGKSALTRALTGVEPDRLAEERRRGLSIELGFAPLVLPGGRTAGLVDVPGHEKFIPTMLSGCAGMDLVLLVVAADEGVMPQTREHLGILSLLGVRGGIIVLTKADLADAARLARVEAQARAAAAGTVLAGAPAVAVSVRTGAGLEKLKALLERQAALLPPPGDGPFRLHVDRVFSVDGSGTVVTGTLAGGPLARGDTVRVYPSGRDARVRGLECHGAPAGALSPGCRAAVNLSGVKPGGVRRGDTLAPPGALVLTGRADASLRLPADSPFPVKNNSQLHFHHGARSLMCRCILLDRDALAPGQACFAQLRFAQPLAARPGDRYVVRFFSPLATVGGGVLLDLSPARRRRDDPDRLEGLDVRASGTELERVARVLGEAGASPVPADVLARDAMVPAAALPGLLTEAGAVAAGGGFLCAAALEKAWRALEARLARNPGLNRGELGLSPAVLDLLARRHGLRLERGGLFLPGEGPAPENGAAAALEALYLAAGRTPPSNREMESSFPGGPAACRAVGRVLVDSGVLTALTPGQRVHSRVCGQALADLRGAFGTAPFTLAQARDALGVSRKYALLYLDYWDRRGVTLRRGEARVLSDRAPVPLRA